MLDNGRLEFGKTINIPEEMQKYIIEDESRYGGRRVRLEFPNGYGASIIHHDFSYGLELAVVGTDGHLDYDTPITDDVLGHLDNESLHQALIDIMNLEGEVNE